MAELKPTRLINFNYVLTAGESFSDFQNEALSSMNWHGLLLPTCQIEPEHMSLVCRISNKISLSELGRTEKLDIGFMVTLINHCGELWAAVDNSQLVADNILFDPDSIFFPPDKLDACEAGFIYLPVWQEQNDNSHACALATGGRLGLVELFLQQNQQLNENQKIELINAAAESMAGLVECVNKLSYTATAPSDLATPQPYFNDVAKTYTAAPSNQAASPPLNGNTIIPAYIKAGQASTKGRFDAFSNHNYAENTGTNIRNRNSNRYLALLIQAVYLVVCLTLPFWLPDSHRKPSFIAISIEWLVLLCLDLKLFVFSRRGLFKRKPINRKTSTSFNTDRAANAPEIRQPPPTANFLQFSAMPSDKEETVKAVDNSLLFSETIIDKQAAVPNNPAFISRSIPGSSNERRSDRIYILRNNFVLGTDPIKADCLLPNHGHRPRSVARIKNNAGTYYIEPLVRDSVSLNGKKLKPYTDCPLPNTATIRLNNTAYYFCCNS
ncbi:DUF6382 domain-containing protein [Mageeibacillus indolicus]|uniref:DUF6382 domain-containing protein n=1 Tax=Mageeibacillus indolicus TaxID=884684 RepID=UPI0004DD8F95|nr:DUF6382 domain-containing protein [Mageeibacillus indolicus]KFA57570.1 hypothetical protein HMPREF1632_02795 [Mageeibacillus indolicus 0009-5]